MKKLFVLIFVLLFSGQAWGNWNPVGFKKWQDSDTNTLFRKRVGGQIANYQKTNLSWATIRNDWVTIEDTLHTNRNALLKTDVNDKGQSFITLKYEGETYTVAQRLIKLVWLKTNTWDWINVVDGAIWSTPSIDSNIIHWTNIFPGVDYRIRKKNVSVAHGIFFKKAFLDSAVILYNQRSDSLDIALGNVIAYELIGVDNADSAIGNVDWRKLKQLGRYIFKLSKQRIYFPGSDTMPELAIKQRWVKKGGKLYCIEFIMMSRIKQIHEVYPNAVIWHNDETTVIEGTTNMDDTDIKSSDADANYGTVTYAYAGYYAGSDDRHGVVRVKNVASELGVGATITGCVCSLYCDIVNIYTYTIYAYRIFKPWTETGVTWNDWVTTDYEWGTAGCMNADDGGSDNSGDGTGADRKETEESSVNFNGTQEDTWQAWSVSTDLAQAWYDETANEEGLLFRTTATEDGYYMIFRTTEYTDDATKQPFFTFTYTTGDGVDKPRKNIMSGGIVK